MKLSKILIDAKLLLEDLGEEPYIWTETDSEIQEHSDWLRFKEMIECQPTVDAVPVVRCKDCSHAIINENHPNKPLICCLTRMCGTTKPEWFCADGERKDNGTV